MEYEYEFVTIELKVRSFTTATEPTADYREIVAERAAGGWRLVAAFNPGTQPAGSGGGIELVFERPATDASSPFQSVDPN